MDTEVEGKWLREGNLLYILEHHGWRKGVEEFRNSITVRVEREPLSTATPERVEALTEQLLEFLTVSTTPTGPGLYEASQVARRKYNAWVMLMFPVGTRVRFTHPSGLSSNTGEVIGHPWSSGERQLEVQVDTNRKRKDKRHADPGLRIDLIAAGDDVEILKEQDNVSNQNQS